MAEVITPIEQTLIGAFAGGFGAAAASVGATAAFARRGQKRTRHDERVEKALEAILEALEGEHWRLVNRYRRQVQIVGGQRDLAAGAAQTPHAALVQSMGEAAYSVAWSDLIAIADTFLEHTRQLRLYVSRIDDPAFRSCFRNYFEAVMTMHISANYVYEAKTGLLSPTESLARPLRALLKETNAKLGHEFRDPGDQLFSSHPTAGDG